MKSVCARLGRDFDSATTPIGRLILRSEEIQIDPNRRNGTLGWHCTRTLETVNHDIGRGRLPSDTRRENLQLPEQIISHQERIVKIRRSPPLYSSNLKGVAPAFLVTTEYDPRRDEGNEYTVKLKAAHVTVEHKELPGMIHHLFGLAGVIDAGKTLIDDTGLSTH
jgi:acetyl esterase/lipase